jgi:hypothetical protein
VSLRPNRYRVAIGARIVTTFKSTARPSHSIALPSTAAGRTAAIDDALAGLPRSALPLLDSIDVALGFPHVHHVVLPWQDAILTSAERHVYAQAVLAEEYGFSPGWEANWHCTLAQEAFGSASIASVMRRDVIEDVTAAARRRRLRFRIVRPLLIDIIESAGRLPDDAVFVACGTQACEFAFRRDAQWHRAFSLPRGSQTEAECLLSAALLAQQFPAQIYNRADIDGSMQHAR